MESFSSSEYITDHSICSGGSLSLTYFSQIKLNRNAIGFQVLVCDLGQENVQLLVLGIKILQ